MYVENDDLSPFPNEPESQKKYTCKHNASVIRQKGESQNGCFKNKKHAKFSEKRTFLTP